MAILMNEKVLWIHSQVVFRQDDAILTVQFVLNGVHMNRNLWHIVAPWRSARLSWIVNGFRNL